MKAWVKKETVVQLDRAVLTGNGFLGTVSHTDMNERTLYDQIYHTPRIMGVLLSADMLGSADVN
jgi:hypothetical protein